MQGLLLKYGEIALRGKNRYIFENKLIENVSKLVPKEYRVKKEQGRILIEAESIDYATYIPVVQNIIGITFVCPCDIIEDNSIENLKAATLNFVKQNHAGESFTFKVATKRAYKDYPLNSLEISAEVGGYLYENFPGLEVDVQNPEVVVNLELRNKAYVFTKVLKAIGGLPSTGDKVLLLLSGGIDSPVAGYLIARRGLTVNAIYFDSPPHTSVRAKQKVIDLAARVGTFTGGMNLHIVNFTDLQMFLYQNVPQDKLTIHLKRAMLRISERLAKKINAYALVTGDSVGQVASQTIHSIRAIDAVTNFPIIRPLATYDKQDIINIANKIETYPISVLPYDDCCTLFVAKHPVTKPRLDIIEKIEAPFEEQLEALICACIDNIELIQS